MTDRKLSQLNTTTWIDGDDLFVLVQSGSTVSISGSKLFTGWISDTVAWTALSSGSGFTRTNGNTVFGVGTKLKYTQGGVTRYGYISSTAGTGGSVANVASGTEPVWAGSAITNQQYSYSNPIDFPAGFTFIPTFTNLTVVGSPAHTGRFQINGRLMKIQITINSNSSGSTASTAGTTFCNNIPVIVGVSDTLNVVTVGGAGYVSGLLQAGQTRAFTPSWTSDALTRYCSGTYEI